MKSRKYQGKQEQVRRRSLSMESSDSSEVDFDGRNWDGKHQQKSKRHRRVSEYEGWRTKSYRREDRQSTSRHKGNISRVSTSESSDSDSSDVEDHRHKRAPPFLKLPSFDGKASKWPGFIFQFRRLAKSGKWSIREKRNRLLGCLRNKAISYPQSRPRGERKDYYVLKDLLNRRYGVLEEPTIARRHLQAMRQEESESLEDFADRVLVKAAEGYPEVPDGTLQALATDNFLRGCKDRSAAYVAVEKKPKDLQSAVQVVREAAVNLKLYGRSGGLVTRQVSFKDSNVEHEKMSDGYTREQRSLVKFLEELFQQKGQASGKRSTASSPVRSRSPSPAHCYKCQEPDHRARDCNQIPLCFKCGKPGHISTKCRSGSPQRLTANSGMTQATHDQGKGNSSGVDKRASQPPQVE